MSMLPRANTIGVVYSSPLFKLCVAFALSAANAFSSVPVFQAYVGYPPCFRQPVLVVLNATSVLAFAEGRNNTYCSGTSDGYPKYINLRRSNDGGLSWSPLQTLFEGNPDFLTAVYDPATEQVHVLIQENSTAVLHAVSRDFGETWSTPVQINISSTFASQLPGCVHGIVVQGSLCSEPTCGGTAGRLLLPFVCHAKASDLARGRVSGDVACPGCFSCVVWSDDHGATWAVGAASTQEGTRESGLAQLVLGVAGDGAGAAAAIYASERNMGASPGTREHAVSLDSGATFSVFGTDPGIPDVDTKNWTGVVAGVTRFDTAGHHERVVITTPAGPNARANLSVFFSTDETATWSPGSVLVPGPAGYSDAVQLNGTAVGVLFENGADEFAAQISFGWIAEGDL